MSYFRRMALILNLILAGAGIALICWKPAKSSEALQLSDVAAPQSAAGFTSDGDKPVDSAVRTALPGAQMLERTYTSSESAPVDFVLVEGTYRTAIHDPRYCLTGAGWQLSSDHQQQLPIPTHGSSITAQACLAATQANAAPSQYVLFMYVIGDRVISSPTQIRAAMLWDALLGRKGTPVYFMRFIQPLDGDPRTAGRDQSHLLSFAAQMEQSVVARARAHA